LYSSPLRGSPLFGSVGSDCELLHLSTTVMNTFIVR